MYEVVIGAIEAMMAVARPGITLGELYDAYVVFYDDAGFGGAPTQPCRCQMCCGMTAAAVFADQKYLACGYALGATYRPTWMDTTDTQSTMIYEGNPLVLAAGMTFLFNVVLTDPSLGLGVAASDTVLITPEGCESLSKLPRDLLVIPTEKPSL